MSDRLAYGSNLIGGGSGGGGHTIEGADGTALSQEPTLQFADADASDDAVNEKTVVNVVRKRTQAQYDAMSAADKAKGIIHITDANAKLLFDTQVRRSNGDGTVADALDNVTVRHEVVTVTVTSGNAVLNSTDYAITNRTILAARSGDYIILPYADRNGVWNVRVLTSAGTPEQSNTINIRIFYIPYVA